MKIINKRWSKENKVEINAFEVCSLFESYIIQISDYLTRVDFVNDRVKKISEKTFNIFETNGTYYEIIDNGYISGDFEYDFNFNTNFHNINELKIIIKEIVKKQKKYNKNIDYIIKSFEKNENYKIVKKLEKFKKSVNQFCEVISKEY